MERGFLIRLLFIVSLLLWSLPQDLFAQDGSNPFDLQHRVRKQPKVPDTLKTTSENPFDIEARKTLDSLIVKTEVIPSSEENPFDINRARPSSQQQDTKQKTVIVETPAEIVKKSKDTRNRLLFWPILVMMILLALLVTLYRPLIGKIYRAFSNENILKLLQREQGAFISIPYLFLYILFFTSAGIFTFQLAYYYEAISFELGNLIYCILGVTVFFIFKHFLLKIIEIIFPISKEVKLYSFTIIIFSIILGILLIPFNVFIAFTQESLTFTGIIGAFIVIGTIYLFRGLRGFFIGSKFLAFHKFHFFMYLCAVEIAPSVVLLKLILNGASIH